MRCALLLLDHQGYQGCDLFLSLGAHKRTQGNRCLIKLMNTSATVAWFSSDGQDNGQRTHQTAHQPV